MSCKGCCQVKVVTKRCPRKPCPKPCPHPKPCPTPWASLLGCAAASIVPYLTLRWYNELPRHRSPPCPSSIDGYYKITNYRVINKGLLPLCKAVVKGEFVRLTSFVSELDKKCNRCIAGVRVEYLDAMHTVLQESVLVYTWDPARGRYALVGNTVVPGVMGGDGYVKIDYKKPFLGIGNLIHALNVVAIDGNGVSSGQLIRIPKPPAPGPCDEEDDSGDLV